MSINLKWWDDGKVLEYHCSGDVDGAELVQANRTAIADPRFAALTCQLCEMDAVTAFNIDRTEIHDIVELDMKAKDVAPHCTRVAIVCRQDLIFGFARMYEMTLEGRAPGWETGVFRTRQQALQWLGIGEGTS